MPGVERFKVAAQKNVTSWWEGKLTMRGGVQRYDPESRGLVEFEQVQGQKGVAVEVEEDQVTLQGPFAYLVSSLVSRFEPTFVVAPLRSPLSPLAPGEKGSIDVVLIRPLREGETAKLVAEGGDQVQQAKEGFVGKVWEVTGGMYDGGTHVDVRYPGGDTVVEYFRCVAFEWEPVSSQRAPPCAPGPL